MNPTSNTLLAGVTLAPAATLIASAALAYPDGAPWGASDPDAAESCASCHYDYEPVMDSAALSIDGLPDSAAPGQRYTLSLAFASATAQVSGFQLTLRACGPAGGTLLSDADDIEAAGAAARSTAPRPVDGVVRWNIEWRAPDNDSCGFQFLVAASAANDDESPFGDTIHYRSFEVQAEGAPGE